MIRTYQLFHSPVAVSGSVGKGVLQNGEREDWHIQNEHQKAYSGTGFAGGGQDLLEYDS
jgi:hypothetical protein